MNASGMCWTGEQKVTEYLIHSLRSRSEKCDLVMPHVHSGVILCREMNGVLLVRLVSKVLTSQRAFFGGYAVQ